MLLSNESDRKLLKRKLSSEKSSSKRPEDPNFLWEKTTIKVEPSATDATIVPENQPVNVSLDIGLVPIVSETNVDA